MNHRYPLTFPLGKIAFMGMLFALLVPTCISIKPPEGGPKDIEAPRLEKTVPAKTIQFKGKTLKLIFDRDIAIQNLQKGLIITPPLKQDADGTSYRYEVKGKELTLYFHHPLEADTTYIFNFLKAIKNAREGVEAEHIKIALSTGDKMDALTVGGTVKFMMTQAPAAKMFVSLYDSQSGGTVFNTRPRYFGQTNGQGDFSIEHIKPGAYTLYVSNEMSLHPKEAVNIQVVGHLKKPIEVMTSKQDIEVHVLELDMNELKFQSAQTKGPYFEVLFNKPIESYTLTLVAPPPSFKGQAVIYSTLNEKKDGVCIHNMIEDASTQSSRFFFFLQEDQPLKAIIKATDALGETIEKQIGIRFDEFDTPSLSAEEAKKADLKITSKPKPDSLVTSLPLTFKLQCNKPIIKVNTSKITLQLDGNDKDPIPVASHEISFNPLRDVITIKKMITSLPPLPQGAQKNASTKDIVARKITLHIAEGALTTPEQDQHEAIQFHYLLQDATQLGGIEGNIVTEAPAFTVQLLDIDNEVIQEIESTSLSDAPLKTPNKASRGNITLALPLSPSSKQYAYRFGLLTTGVYRIRVLIRKGPTVSWSAGNIKKGISPDPVAFYEAPLVVTPQEKLLSGIEIKC